MALRDGKQYYTKLRDVLEDQSEQLVYKIEFTLYIQPEWVEEFDGMCILSDLYSVGDVEIKKITTMKKADVDPNIGA